MHGIFNLLFQSAFRRTPFLFPNLQIHSYKKYQSFVCIKALKIEHFSIVFLTDFFQGQGL
jgi:hypothetical protein